MQLSYRAIVFDLAGVLLDSEQAHEQAARLAAERLGLTAPEAAWRRISGGAYEDFFDYLLSLPQNASKGVRSRQVVLLAHDFYHEEVRRSARLFSGAIDTLSTSRSTFPSVGIATSSEWRLIDSALGHFGLREFFDAVVCGDHTTQRKPAPEVFLVAAWLLGVRPASMVVIEDSIQGVRAARRARARVIGLATGRDGNALREAGAHVVVRDHAELTDYLREMDKAGRIATECG